MKENRVYGIVNPSNQIDAAIRGHLASFIHPESTRFKRRFLRQRATIPEDASLGEILDHIMDHGIFLEMSSRLRVMNLHLRGAAEHMTIDWSKTEV